MQWSYATGGGVYSSPALSSDGLYIYVGSEDGCIYALDSHVGLLAWNYFVGGSGSAIYSSPAIDVTGILYIGDDNNNIYALNATTGSFLWKFSTEYCINSSPAIWEGGVYIGSDDGYLYAFNAQTGIT